MPTMDFSKDEIRPNLVYHRQPPVFDSEIHNFQSQINGHSNADPAELLEVYIEKFEQWILSSKLNNISGLEALPHRDFCVGVTGYLDDLYVRYGNRIRYISGEYSYHWRLNVGKKIEHFSELVAGDQFIISEPFAYSGLRHPEIDDILDHCNQNSVDVHIDSAWFGCVRNFNFSYDSQCIKSAGFSLSKGLSSGHNRMGIRFARNREPGPITIVNDFNMGVAHLMWLGIKMMEKYDSDFLQNKYYKLYQELCRSMGFQESGAIHVAMGPHPDDQSLVPVGVGPILKKCF